MGYIEEVLLRNETVVYRAKTHWIVFVSSVFGFLVGLILLIPESSRVVGVIFALGSLIGLIRALIQYRSSEFAITNQRVLAKSGTLQRRTLELQLGKVESVRVNQGLLGRLLDFGTVNLIGSGGTNEPFPQIARPIDFRREIQVQLDKLHDEIAGRKREGVRES